MIRVLIGIIVALASNAYAGYMYNTPNTVQLSRPVGYSHGHPSQYAVSYRERSRHTRPHLRSPISYSSPIINYPRQYKEFPQQTLFSTSYTNIHPVESLLPPLVTSAMPPSPLPSLALPLTLLPPSLPPPSGLLPSSFPPSPLLSSPPTTLPIPTLPLPTSPLPPSPPQPSTILPSHPQINSISHYQNTQYSSSYNDYSDGESVDQFLPAQPSGATAQLETSDVHVDEDYDTHADIELENHGPLLGEPIVTKHIYFHVPPADVEEHHGVVSPAPSQPPKKIYNILFIKVPAQQSVNYAAQLQPLANQHQPIEDKTLIYVLVQKPEEPIPQIVTPRVNSEHEVFYVKYSGDISEAAAEIDSQHLAHLDKAYADDVTYFSSSDIQTGYD